MPGVFFFLFSARIDDGEVGMDKGMIDGGWGEWGLTRAWGLVAGRWVG